MSLKATLRHYLELHLIVGILSFTAILGLLLEGITPLSLIFWRTLLAVVGLSIVLGMEKGKGSKETGKSAAVSSPFSLLPSSVQ